MFPNSIHGCLVPDSPILLNTVVNGTESAFLNWTEPNEIRGDESLLMYFVTAGGSSITLNVSNFLFENSNSSIVPGSKLNFEVWRTLCTFTGAHVA